MLGKSSFHQRVGVTPKETSARLKPMEELVSSYYLRVFVRDQPGVLAQIAGVLGQHRISIESMMQPHRHEADAVPIIMMTHEALERDVRAALAEIDALEAVRGKSLLVRVEDQAD